MDEECPSVYLPPWLLLLFSGLEKGTGQREEEGCGWEEGAELEHWRVRGAGAGTSSVRGGGRIWHAA